MHTITTSTSTTTTSGRRRGRTVPAYFLGRPVDVYVDRYRRRSS